MATTARKAKTDQAAPKQQVRVKAASRSRGKVFRETCQKPSNCH